MPSIEQLQALANALEIDVTSFFVEAPKDDTETKLSKKYNIAVAGTGYVGLSLAVLLPSTIM